MKIALFTDGLTPFVMGGIQRHSYYLCKYLAKSGVKLHLYHTVPYFSNNSSSCAPDLKSIFTPDELDNIRSFLIPFPRHKKIPGHYIRESYEYSCRVYDAFLQNSRDVDFVYSKNYTSWKYLEEKQKGKQLPPIGVKLHGYELFQVQTSFNDWIGAFFHKEPTLFNSRMADIVFSYGGKITEILQKKAGVLSEQIREIPTGISEDWLLKGEKHMRYNDKTNFIFLGRYARRKGIHLIEKVIPKCNSKKSTFTFVGPIPEKKRLNLPNVRYTGPLTNESEIQMELQKADVLLCPSTSEGMPNVILEGMASGCVIIATDVGAVASMVNHKNGFIIDSSNWMGLFQAIDNCILTSKIELSNMQKNSLERVQDKFLWTKVIRDVIETINAISREH